MLTKKLLTSLTSGVLAITTALTPVMAANKTPFTDIPKEDTWYTNGVGYCYAHGILTGTSPTTFSPDKNMDRAMLVTALYRMDGEPSVSGQSSFMDVPAGAYYSKAVAWAAANNIVTGFSSTSFKPGDPVTREQFSTILARYHVYKGYGLNNLASLADYPDADAIAPYAVEGMEWAVGNGIITGNQADGKFYLNPRGESTRAQIATIIFRYGMHGSWDEGNTPSEPLVTPTQTVQNWLSKGVKFFWAATASSATGTQIGSMEFKDQTASWNINKQDYSSTYSLSGFRTVPNPNTSASFPDSAFEGTITFDEFKVGEQSFGKQSATILFFLNSSQTDYDVYTSLRMTFESEEINKLVTYSNNNVSLVAATNSLFVKDDVDYSNASEATREVFRLLTQPYNGVGRYFNIENMSNPVNPSTKLAKYMRFLPTSIRIGLWTDEAAESVAGAFYTLGEFTKNENIYTGKITFDDLYVNGKSYEGIVYNMTLSVEAAEISGVQMERITFTMIPENSDISQVLEIREMTGSHFV